MEFPYRPERRRRGGSPLRRGRRGRSRQPTSDRPRPGAEGLQGVRPAQPLHRRRASSKRSKRTIAVNGRFEITPHGARLARQVRRERQASRGRAGQPPLPGHRARQREPCHTRGARRARPHACSTSGRATKARRSRRAGGTSSSGATTCSSCRACSSSSPGRSTSSTSIRRLRPGPTSRSTAGGRRRRATSSIKEQSLIEEKAYRDTWGRGLDVVPRHDGMTAPCVMRELLLAKQGRSTFTSTAQCWSLRRRLCSTKCFGAENFPNEIVWAYWQDVGTQRGRTTSIEATTRSSSTRRRLLTALQSNAVSSLQPEGH